MAVADKLNQTIGFLAVEEATPYTAETLDAALDGLNPYIGDGDPDPPEPIAFVYDGTIGNAAGSLAPQKRTTPSGRHRMGTFRCLPKGLGSAYNGSVIPPREVHRMLKAAGFTATYSASPSHQWQFDPTAVGTTPTHLTLRQYAQGSIYNHTGVQCDWSYETQGLGVPVWTFPYRGLVSAPSDGALAAITTLAPTVIPPVAGGMTVTINSVTTLVVRSVKYSRNRSLEPARVALNVSGGHAGFIGGRYVPEWEVEVENPARATFDADALYAAGTNFGALFEFGATQYNRWKHGTVQGQIADAPTPGADGGLATLTFKIRGYASTPSANDAEYVLFN